MNTTTIITPHQFQPLKRDRPRKKARLIRFAT
jgi:hypothetical protein